MLSRPSKESLSSPGWRGRKQTGGGWIRWSLLLPTLRLEFMSHAYNSAGVIKATVGTTKGAGYVARGKKSFTPGRLLVSTTAPDAGTVLGGVGTANGIMSVVLGPAPAGAIRKRGRAFLGGQQYYVTSGTAVRCIDRMSFTANGDLLVDTA